MREREPLRSIAEDDILISLKTIFHDAGESCQSNHTATREALSPEETELFCRDCIALYKMEEALAEKLSSICDHHPTINLDLNYHLRLLPISEMAILRLRPYNDSVDIKYQLTVSDILHRPLVRMTEFLRTTLRDVESGALPCAGSEDARSIASFVQDQIHGIAQRVGHFVYQYAHSSHRDDPSWLTRNFPDELTRLSPHIVE